MVFRLVYTSRAQLATQAEVLEQIAGSCLRNNARDGLSGALAYDAGGFLQCLEGPEGAVRACFARIAADPRHNDVGVLFEQTAENRAFPDWSMAMVRVTAPLADLKTQCPRDILRVLVTAAQDCEGVRAIPGHGPAPEARNFA